MNEQNIRERLAGGDSIFEKACLALLDEKNALLKRLAVQQPAQDGLNETVLGLMAQVQEFASAWALVGTRFDTGNGHDEALTLKNGILDALIVALSRAAHTAPDRNAVLEEAAKAAEGGCFIHDDAPDARIARACAAAIRRLKDQHTAPVVSEPKESAQAFLAEVTNGYREWKKDFAEPADVQVNLTNMAAFSAGARWYASREAALQPTSAPVAEQDKQK